MIEEFCPPCPEPEEFSPKPIDELCPCPVEKDQNLPYLPRRSSITVETECYTEMIRKMTSVFHCKPFDAC